MKLVDKLDFSTFINCLDIVLLELENEFDSRIGYSEIDIRNLRKKIAYSIEKNHDSFDLSKIEIIILNNCLNELLHGLNLTINDSEKYEILFVKLRDI